MPKKVTKDEISSGTGMLFNNMKPLNERPADKEKKVEKISTRTKKVEPAADEKPQKPAEKIFGVQLQESTIARVNEYTEATGRTKKEWITAALTEYMNRHKPTQEQKAAYQKKLKEKQKAAAEL